MYPALNFPEYPFRIKADAGQGHEIFDRVRKKYVALTPEEWVRQHLLEFMMNEKQFPLSLLAIEKQLKLNNTLKRTDVLAYDNTLKPVFLAECKAPSINLDIHTVNQAMRYNLVFNVSCFLITNGIDHYVFMRDPKQSGWIQADHFPMFGELLMNALPNS